MDGQTLLYYYRIAIKFIGRFVFILSYYVIYESLHWRIKQKLQNNLKKRNAQQINVTSECLINNSTVIGTTKRIVHGIYTLHLCGNFSF